MGKRETIWLRISTVILSGKITPAGHVSPTIAIENWSLQSIRRITEVRIVAEGYQSYLLPGKAAGATGLSRPPTVVQKETRTPAVIYRPIGS